MSSSRTNETSDIKNARLSRVYGIAQTVLLVGFAGTILLDHSMPLFSATRVTTAVGKAICVIGVAVIGAAIYSLRRVIQIAPAPRQSGTLVTAGVYRWLRHPIYTAMLLEVIGLFLVEPRLSVGLAAAAVGIYLAFKVRFEEKLLALRYPDYAAFKSRSFGLIPLWRG